MFNWFKKRKKTEEQASLPAWTAEASKVVSPIRTQRTGPLPEPNERIYCLQHIESREFICLLQEGTDHLACFSSGDDACEFRASLGLVEHVDIHGTTFAKSPFRHFWFDGDVIVMPEC